MGTSPGCGCTAAVPVDRINLYENRVDQLNAMNPQTAEDVFESIHSVMHLYRAQQYQALRRAGHELTHMETKVLGFVAAHPGTTQRHLVESFSRDKAQLARLIKTLREKSLLDGQVDENDRRSLRLDLTPAGQTLYEAIRLQSAQMNDAAVQGFSEEQCQALVRLLEAIKVNLCADSQL